MKNLKVKIRKKHKAALEYRFDAKNAKLFAWEFSIDKECSLCEIHNKAIKKRIIIYCKGYPFNKFKTEKDITGCAIWLSKVMGEINFLPGINYVEWAERHHATVTEQLRKLRRKAKELITWY